MAEFCFSVPIHILISPYEIRQFCKLVKRWSEAESFTILENHVYMSKKNLMFAQKLVAIF